LFPTARFESGSSSR